MHHRFCLYFSNFRTYFISSHEFYFLLFSFFHFLSHFPQFFLSYSRSHNIGLYPPPGGVWGGIFCTPLLSGSSGEPLPHVVEAVLREGETIQLRTKLKKVCWKETWWKKSLWTKAFFSLEMQKVAHLQGFFKNKFQLHYSLSHENKQA